MHLKTVHLFFLLSLFWAAIGNWFPVGFGLAIIFGLITLLYFTLDKINKPIDEKTGSLHFDMSLLGLCFSLPLFQILNLIFESWWGSIRYEAYAFMPDAVAVSIEVAVSLVLGPFFCLQDLLCFLAESLKL